MTIVQRPRHLMNPFDADAAALIHQEMRAHGVHLALGRSVEGFEERDGGIDVLVAGEAVACRHGGARHRRHARHDPGRDGRT